MTTSDMGRLLCIASRVAAGITAAPVIVKTRMNPETYWECPHCASEIHEKALYFDGENFFHRAAACLNKPILLP